MTDEEEKKPDCDHEGTIIKEGSINGIRERCLKCGHTTFTKSTKGVALRDSVRSEGSSSNDDTPVEASAGGDDSSE